MPCFLWRKQHCLSGSRRARSRSSRVRRVLVCFGEGTRRRCRRSAREGRPDSIAAGLAGLETLSGIPGSVGGAVVGNAGAYGHSIAGSVRRVLVVAEGRERWMTKRECAFSYRESIVKKKPFAVLRVELRLRRGEQKELAAMSRTIVSMRKRKYRPGLKCPGSFFKNVPVNELSSSVLWRIDPARIIKDKVPAGYLFEAVGAKGMHLGGIRIPDVHANLLENAGGATAKDVRRLAGILKKRVEEKFGVTLEEEVRYFEDVPCL